MRQQYDSFKYWESIIREHKTIRGHMFMNELPTKKTLYIHTLIFSKNNGIDNIYAYFPDVKSLLGYIQYSFLQEAFYKWIYCKNSAAIDVPSKPADKIIREGFDDGLITKETYKIMMDSYKKIKNMWHLSKDRVLTELIKFAREFNKMWFGNNKEFLYMKIFKTPVELGEFVVESTMLTNSEKEFENKVGVSIDRWSYLCKNLNKDKSIKEEFRKILQRNLSEVI